MQCGNKPLKTEIMKLLKIGSSSSCDIVLHSQYVSALHAEITLLDNGEFVIEDKNSSNGTFVGNTKITPNTEVSIKRGDYVRIADTDLPWGRIPTIKSPKCDLIVNIGSSFRNDIALNSNAVSRYHAVLKIVGRKAFICDNGSKNGTLVNGVKIAAGKDVQIKKGDNILCADEDITDLISQYIPSNVFRKLAMPTAIIAVAAAIVGLCFLILPSKEPKEARDLIPATVYIHSAYHYNVKIAGITFRWPVDENEYKYASGTGFFVDREGRIGTVRHVAVPWDEAYNSEERETAEMAIREYLHSQLRVTHVTSQQDFNVLCSTNIGKAIADQCETVPKLNAILSSILSSTPTIDGVMDFLAVGYSGQSYQAINSFERCMLVAESGNADKDVALLQLNSKKTPDFIKYVFDLEKVTDKVIEPMSETLYTIGYPHGLLWNLNEKDMTLSPSIRKTTCSKTPTKYNFQFQESSVGGASGSPVFLFEGHLKKTCRLVGVLSAAYASEAGPTVAAHAYFLRKLYEDNTTKIAH